MKRVIGIAAAAALFFVGPASSATAQELQLAPSTIGVQNTRPVASDDYTSIFAHAPELINSGWSQCESPVTWIVDTRGLSAAQGKRQLTNLRWALRLWSRASGLRFVFGGTTALTFDEDDFTLTPEHAPGTGGRRVFFDFIAARKSNLLAGETVAAAGPSSVVIDSKEIVTGTAVFETEYIKTATDRQARSLYLHEIGHVLGLGHARSASNIMHPIVTDRLKLGPGDINGIQAMTKPCASTPARVSAIVA